MNGADGSRDREVEGHLSEQELDALLASLPEVRMPEESWRRIDAALAQLPPLSSTATPPGPAGLVSPAEPGEAPAGSATSPTGTADAGAGAKPSGTVVTLRPRRWYESAGARVAVAAGAALVAVGVLSTWGPAEPESEIPAVSAPRLLAGEDGGSDTPQDFAAGSDAQPEAGSAAEAPEAGSAAGTPEQAADAPDVTPNRVRTTLPGSAAQPIAVLPGSDAAEPGVTGAQTWTVSGPVEEGTVLTLDGMTLSFAATDAGAAPSVGTDDSGGDGDAGDASELAPEGAAPTASAQAATSVTLAHTPAVRILRVAVSDDSSTAVYAEDGDGELTDMAAALPEQPDPVVQRVTVYYDLTF